MDPVTFEVADRLTAIDTFFAGRERYTAAYLLEADEPAIIETGPTTSEEAVVAGLDHLGIGPRDLAHIVLTHIHLDHAGGVGRLSARYPEATVWVHERGAPHLADPTKLVASAERIYGGIRMASLFGAVDPVPAQRIRRLSDGDVVALGGRTLEALDTPGHASHHLALVDAATGAVFTGDALGIHSPGVAALRPATPPPDFDLELAVRSIERIRQRARSGIMLFAHFGPVVEVDRICDLAVRRTRSWAEVVREALRRTDDLDEIVALLEGEARRDVETGAEAAIDLQRFETLSSIRMNAMGLMRYWRRRRGSEAPDAGAPAEPRRPGS